MSHWLAAAIIGTLACFHIASPSSNPGGRYGEQKMDGLSQRVLDTLCLQEMRNIQCGADLGPVWERFIDDSCPKIHPKPYHLEEALFSYRQDLFSPRKRRRPASSFLPQFFHIGGRTLAEYGPETSSQTYFKDCTLSLIRKVCHGVEDAFWTYMGDHHRESCHASYQIPMQNQTQNPQYPQHQGYPQEYPQPYLQTQAKPQLDPQQVVYTQNQAHQQGYPQNQAHPQQYPQNQAYPQAYPQNQMYHHPEPSAYGYGHQQQLVLNYDTFIEAVMAADRRGTIFVDESNCISDPPFEAQSGGTYTIGLKAGERIINGYMDFFETTQYSLHSDQPELRGKSLRLDRNGILTLKFYEGSLQRWTFNLRKTLHCSLHNGGVRLSWTMDQHRHFFQPLDDYDSIKAALKKGLLTSLYFNEEEGSPQGSLQGFQQNLNWILFFDDDLEQELIETLYTEVEYNKGAAVQKWSDFFLTPRTNVVIRKEGQYEPLTGQTRFRNSTRTLRSNSFGFKLLPGFSSPTKAETFEETVGLLMSGTPSVLVIDTSACNITGSFTKFQRHLIENWKWNAADRKIQISKYNFGIFSDADSPVIFIDAVEFLEGEDSSNVILSVVTLKEQVTRSPLLLCPLGSGAFIESGRNRPMTQLVTVKQVVHMRQWKPQDVSLVVRLANCQPGHKYNSNWDLSSDLYGTLISDSWSDGTKALQWSSHTVIQVEGDPGYAFEVVSGSLDYNGWITLDITLKKDLEKRDVFDALSRRVLYCPFEAALFYV